MTKMQQAADSAARRIGAPGESEPPAAFAWQLTELAAQASQMRHQDIMTTEPVVGAASLSF
jgi:hypothetical protein